MPSVFITGGANGIGAATARRFLADGWRVGIGDVARPASSIPGIAFHHLDVRDLDGWRVALEDFTTPDDGALDLLINNAGIVRYGRFGDIGAAQSKDIVDVNLIGTINGVSTALPHLERRKRSTVVNIASMGAMAGGPLLAVYCATKFGVRGLSEALDTELSPMGVSVRCVMPFFTDTAMVHQPGVKMNSDIARDFGGTRVHSPEKVAEAIFKAAHSGKLHHPVGLEGRLVALIARLAPGFLRNQSKRQMRR